MERFCVGSSDGRTALAAYRLVPNAPKALVQISHGMCEYFLRYKEFAAYLAEQGFLGILSGGLTACAGGITAAVFFGLLVALLCKPKDKTK